MMRDFLCSIRERSARNPRRIVLPETDDPRTIEAIRFIVDNKIAKVIAIGRDDVKAKVAARNVRDIEVLEPERYKDIDDLATMYYELRKHKGMTLEEAGRIVRKEYVVFGALLVRRGMADGFVAGASHTTPDVVRTAIHCLAPDKSVGVVSGAFVMEVPNCAYGESGVFVFADCGVNPDPDPVQLAGIAIASAKLFTQLVGSTARVAFLSYSTKGSAKGPLVEKAVEAVKKARAQAPDLAIDGEFQVDSALVPEVAKRKCPGSEVGGRANVLIFPNLDSGNISYKLVQRLANARAVGPILMGTLQPCSDLSRGCSADDIIDAVAVTSVRAE